MPQHCRGRSDLAIFEVPESAEAIYTIGSCEPAAMLCYAHERFEAGDVRCVFEQAILKQTIAVARVASSKQEAHQEYSTDPGIHHQFAIYMMVHLAIVFFQKVTMAD